MSTTSFKIGDRVRWTGQRPLGTKGKTFADAHPEQVGKLGTILTILTAGRTARVFFDDGKLTTGTYFDNLELVEKPIAIGDRVVIGLITQRDKRGVVVDFEEYTQYPYLVRLDGETIRRCYSLEHLTKETKTVSIPNIKGRVKGALDSLFSVIVEESAKEQAVRRLGIAAALVTRGEAEKKAAKAKLKELGVIRDEYGASTTETVFDSERYTVDAVTNAGSQRLDLPSLEAALAAEKLSSAMRQRILNGALKDVKPATSFKVESK